MAKIFESFLGTGALNKDPGYDRATYNWPGKSAITVTACFAQTAILKILEEKAADEGPVDKVIFLPDQFLGKHVASQTGVELVLWHGRCEVHEKFTAGEARHARERFDAKLVAHPECPPEVLAEADFVGSTSAMGRWLAKEQPKRVALITECSMADNLRAQFPRTEFIKPCNLCPHMQRITLPNIYAALRDLRHEIHIPADIIERARGSLTRMLAVGRQERV